MAAKKRSILRFLGITLLSGVVCVGVAVASGYTFGVYGGSTYGLGGYGAALLKHLSGYSSHAYGNGAYGATSTTTG